MLYKTCTVAFLGDFLILASNQLSRAKTQSNLFFTNLICSGLSEVKAIIFAISSARETPEGIW